MRGALLSTTSIKFSNAAFALGILFAGLLASSVVAHPEESEPPQPLVPLTRITPPDPAILMKGTVVRVLDGDTVLVLVDGVKYRYQLLGANAPEYAKADPAPKVFALESKRALEHLILGEEVFVHHDPLGHRDSANRRSCYLFRSPNMLLINLELVRQGFAKHDPRHMSLYTNHFQASQSKAAALAKGIWSHQDNPLDWADPSEVFTADPDSPPRPTQSSPKPSAEAPLSPEPPEQTVATEIYISKTGKKYHRQDCAHLSKTKIPTTRSQIETTHKPCKVCRPDG